MHRVWGTAEVSQCIPLCQVLQHQGFWEPYYYDANYHALLTTRLARVGNLEACFLANLCTIFVEAHRSLTLPRQTINLVCMYMPSCSTGPIPVVTMTILPNAC
jgi:hypothetical protein